METIKVGLIGAGGIGGLHSQMYARIASAQVAGVADIRFEKAQALAAQHGARAYASVDELLANEALDMVDICTPTYTHSAIAVQCAQQGLHVLCEKPMALQLPDAQAMVAAAQANGVLLMVAQVIRFWAEYVYLKEALDTGRYGKLLHAWFSRVGGAPLWSWENWYLDPQRSGLAPYDLHIHDADFIHHLLGLPRQVGSVGYERPEVFASYLKTQYYYDTGTLVEAEGGWWQGGYRFGASYRAVFEQAVLEYKNDQLLLYPAGAQEPQKLELHQQRLGGSLNLSEIGPYYTEIAYFVDCVRSGVAPSIITPQQSLDTLHMLLGELESARTGRIVEFRC